MKKRPQVQKAINFLKQGFSQGLFGRKLPSIKTLATGADVSFVTMWKAINILRHDVTFSNLSKTLTAKNDVINKTSQNILESSSADSNFQFKENYEPLWQKSLSRIKQDILTGRFSPGTLLPSRKELESMYNISYPTLKKVIEILCEEKIIMPHQRGYIVSPLTKSESSSRIVAIGCGWEDGTLWMDHQDKNYFRILESECIQSKIALDIVVYCQHNDKIAFIDTITKKPYDLSKNNILSFILIIANLGIQPEDVLKRLIIEKKPIAVLDVVGGWEIPSQLFNNYYVQLFTVTMSITPPKKIAQYLLNLGHKNIAFFSPFHKAEWSKQRLKGIAETYNEAGYKNNVKTFVLDKYAFQWDYLQSGYNSEKDVKEIVNEYNKWKKYTNSEFFRKFGHISYNISKYLTEWNCATGEIYHQMISLFKEALKDKEITAWVMANDYTATLALDYLKEIKVSVPEDISLISFDNTLDAMEYRITSYDFNLNGIVSIMLRYALWPSSVVTHRTKSIIEVDGAIIDRRSVLRVS
jgi:DNA-binding transcriptional regulator YhcF (GntR family)